MPTDPPRGRPDPGRRRHVCCSPATTTASAAARFRSTQDARLELALDFVGGTSTQVTEPAHHLGRGTVQVRRGEIALNSSLTIQDGTSLLLESGDLPQNSAHRRYRLSRSRHDRGSQGAGSTCHPDQSGHYPLHRPGMSDSVLHGSTLINEASVVFDSPHIEIAGSGIDERADRHHRHLRDGQLWLRRLRRLACQLPRVAQRGHDPPACRRRGLQIISVQFINSGGTIQVDGGTLTSPARSASTGTRSRT